jgi:hypothetical protein
MKKLHMNRMRGESEGRRQHMPALPRVDEFAPDVGAQTQAIISTVLSGFQLPITWISGQFLFQVGVLVLLSVIAWKLW